MIKKKKIIPQLQKFEPKQSVWFTALGCLKEVDDIKKFFFEMTKICQKESPEHPDAREIVRSDLAYISGYSISWLPQWERFNEVLKDEFDDAIKKVSEAHIKKKR